MPRARRLRLQVWSPIPAPLSSSPKARQSIERWTWTPDLHESTPNSPIHILNLDPKDNTTRSGTIIYERTYYDLGLSSNPNPAWTKPESEPLVPPHMFPWVRPIIRISPWVVPILHISSVGSTIQVSDDQSPPCTCLHEWISPHLHGRVPAWTRASIHSIFNSEGDYAFLWPEIHKVSYVAIDI